MKIKIKIKMKTSLQKIKIEIVMNIKIHIIIKIKRMIKEECISMKRMEIGRCIRFMIIWIKTININNPLTLPKQNPLE